MRIRYVFNVEARSKTEQHGAWRSIGAREADAGTLYGAQQQVQLEIESYAGVGDEYRFALVAAIGLTGR